MIVSGNAKEAASVQTRLTSEELYDTLKKAVKFCNSHEMEISFTSPGWIEEEKLRKLGLMVPSCGACLSNMAVTPDGKAVPCQSALSGVPLGDMQKDSFQKIWKSKNCKKQRKYAAQMKHCCPIQEEILQ